MSNQTGGLFQQADILLYTGADPTAFSVVACDQFTSAGILGAGQPGRGG